MQKRLFVLFSLLFVLLAFTACQMPLEQGTWAGTNDAASFSLPPDQVENEIRILQGEFAFETLLPTSIELSFLLYDGTDSQPVDYSETLPEEIPLIHATITAQDGSVLYTAMSKADKILSAGLFLPAASRVYSLNLKAEGFDPREIKIKDMAAYSNIRRTVSLLGSSGSVSMSLTAGSIGIGPMRDSDGDSVPDIHDAYPDDPDAAFVMNIPADQNITLAFEDLFGRENAGDADYNDFIANYRIQQVIDAAGRVTRLIIQAEALQKLAGYNHAFGIRIDSFEGKAALSGTFINRAGNEASLARKVEAPAEIVLFDRTDKALGREAYFVLEFDSPQYISENSAPDGTAILSPPPFNPYLYVYNTGHDIHLIDAEPLNRSINPDDRFIDSNGFPWALLIPIDWQNPAEGQRIEELYPEFTDWRLSGGTDFRDWYENPYDPEDPVTDVLKAYIAGSSKPGDFPIASYWVVEDSVVNRVDLNPAGKSGASDIFVDESGSVYVAGYYRNSAGQDVAVYWKDGVQSSDLAVNARATGIGVDDAGTVFVSGYYFDGAMSTSAVYWSDNGSVSEVVLQSGTYAKATDIKVSSSGTVYISGISNNQLAVYWVNNASGLNVLTGTAGSNAQAVYYDGSRAYIAGRYLTNTAAYWEEGVSAETQLNTVGGQAYGIFTESGSVYTAGDYFDLGLPGKRAAWWLDDSSGQTDLFGTDPLYPTTAYDIMVVGSDVYITGTQNTGVMAEAVYWKNGSVVSLQPGIDSEASSIFFAE